MIGKIKKIKIDKVVLLVSIASLLWIILYKILFLKIFEIFQYANEIAEVFYGILSSIVASGIFYFFVVYLDRKQKQKITNKIVLNRLASIRTGLFIIKKDVFPILGLKYNSELPELEEFMKICKGLDFRTIAPSIPNTTEMPIIWYDYFDYFFQSDKYISQLLYSHIIYLDVEIIELLDQIQYSYFQRALDSFRTNGYTHDISGTPGPFWTYLHSLEAISKYCEKQKGS